MPYPYYPPILDTRRKNLRIIALDYLHEYQSILSIPMKRKATVSMNDLTVDWIKPLSFNLISTPLEVDVTIRYFSGLTFRSIKERSNSL
ncbi:hypothetical protein [Sphingobacterium hotanense]|uniref:hypothetical protein n=1 Tax=Sphingobacterium hotanense TaxID=649196 RepID=UPI0011F27C84|nr:hypothetical protein [Sphingobacterium hotanense]